MAWLNLNGSPVPGNPLDHEEKVARVVAQLRAQRGDRPLSLRKKAPSHQVPKARDRKYSDDKIDLSDLDRILSIDVQARTCTAEPGVTFVDLVEATLAHGLVPLVVPELRTITLGGAVSGCSIESMSFRCGGFADTCLAYEVISAQGEVLHCTPENEHQLVFQMMHGSFGTLGILSKLTFRLVPATPFVRVEYHTHRDHAAYQAEIAAVAAGQDVDFMDGIIHGPEQYVLSLGHFVDSAPYTSRYEWVKAYYETTAERREDYFRTADYFFRYDRGVTNVRPRSRVGRLLVGPFSRSTPLLRLAEKFYWMLPAERPSVTVDVFVPFSRFGDFMTWYWREFGTHPLWCVPYRPARRYEWLADEWWAKMQDEMVIDLAIYGYPQKNGRNYYRMLEEKLLELNGMKTLISHNFYAPDEFWSTWSRPNYEAVKRITDPRNLFRDVYTKTCRAARGLD